LRKRTSAAARPGRPAKRACKPTDIILGAVGVEQLEGIPEIGEELVT
jgi:hypothetical protein